MITPKAEQQTARDEREAYELANLRDRETCVRCRRQGEVQRDHRIVALRGIMMLPLVPNWS